MPNIGLVIVAIGVVAICYVIGFAGLFGIPADRANWLTTISFVVSVPGFAYMVCTLFQLQKAAARARKDRDEVMLVVSFNGRTEELAYRPLRGGLSRAELLGILGLFAGVPRFETADVLGMLCRGDLKHIADGTRNKIVVELDPENPKSPGLFEEILARNAKCRLDHGTEETGSAPEGQS